MVDLAFTAGLPRHLAPAQRRHGRHRRPRAEGLVWTVSTAVRLWRGDAGPRFAVAFASLFLAFAILIGAIR